MPALTYKVALTTTNDSGDLLEADQAAANRTDGWVSAKLAALNMSEFDAGTKKASGTFSTAVKPASFLTGSTCNAFSPLNAFSGTFDSGAWTFTFTMRCTTASAQRGRMRMRVFKSASPTGSGATELTGATQIGTTVAAALSVSADQTSTVTWSPGTTIVLDNEYLFFVLAWEITTAGGSNSADVVIRTGQAGGVGSKLVTPNFTLRAPLAFPRTASDSWTVSDSAGVVVNPIYTTLIDDFNRTDGGIYFDAGAAIWADQHFDGSGLTSLAILANRLAGPPSKSSAYTLTEIDSAERCDIVIDCAVAPAVSPGEFSFYPLYTDPGSAFNCYGIHWVTPGNWYFGRYTNGSWSQMESNIGGGAAYSIATGDSVWFAKRPSVAQPGFFELWVYLRKGSGPWVSVIGPTLGNYSPARSNVAIELADATQRWDNLRGGPVYVAPPLYEDIIDDFNRADGLLGTDWVLAPIAGGAATDLRVISNRLGNSAGGTQAAYTTKEIDNSSGDCDVLVDLSVNTGSSSFNLYFLVTNPGTATWSGYRVAYTGGVGSIALTRWANGSNVESLASGGTGGFTAGQMLWFRKRGSSLTLLRFSNGGWSILLHATDADHNPASGVCGIELTDTVTRWDNLRGGPLVVTGPPTYPVTASDSWTVSDSVTRGPGSVAPAYAAEVLTDNPISYWRLGNNVTIHDEIGTVPDVTSSGGWTADGLLTGDPDTSILFDGGDDIITFPNVAAHAVNNGTLELWTKTIEFGVGGSYRGMFVKSEAYGIFMENNQLMTYDWELGGGGNRMSGVFLNDNVRHHVVMTFQSGVAGGSQFYVDGVAVGAPFQITVKYQSTSGFNIAANMGVQLFRGHLDEVAFYGTVLSPARINAHYQTGIGVGGGGGAMFTRTASDAWAVADSAVGAQILNLVRAATDSVAFSDSAIVKKGVSRTATDSWAISDAVVRAPATRTRPAADFISTSDVANRAAVTRVRPVIDAVATSDQANRTAGARARTATDSWTSSDTAVRAPAARTRPATDVWATSDTATRAPATRVRPVIDVVAVSDAAVRAPAPRTRTTADSWTSSDSAIGVAQVTQGKTAVDSWSVADIVTRGTAVSSTAFDAVAFSDTATRTAKRNLTAADSVAFSDSVTGTKVIVRGATDTVGTADVANRAAGARARTAVDSWTRSDIATRAPATRARPASDAVTLSDTAVQAVTARVRGAVDSWSASDTAAGIKIGGSLKTAVDSFTVNDVAVRAAVARAREAVDSVATSDTTTRVSTRARTAVDSWTRSDTAVGAKVSLRGAVDSVVITDIAVRAPAAKPRIAADLVSVTDSVARIAAHPGRTAVDSWTRSDVATVRKGYIRPTIDVITVSDTAIRGIFTQQRIAFDSITVSSTAQRGTFTRQRIVVDTILLTDMALRSAVARIRAAVDAVAVSDVAGAVMRTGSAPQMTMML